MQRAVACGLDELPILHPRVHPCRQIALLLLLERIAGGSHVRREIRECGRISTKSGRFAA